MNWWRAVGFAGFLLGWLHRASADGKITHDEVIQLVSAAIAQFGIDVEIDIEPPPSR